MLDLVNGFPEMCQKALSIKIPKKRTKIKNIVVMGMGGSAIAGDILKDCLEIRVDVVREYSLPKWVDKDSLFIAISYSGDTEETVACFTSCLGMKNILAVTSGGKIAEIAENNEIDTIDIPKGLPPRASLPYILFPILRFLRSCGVKAEGLEEAVKSLKNVKETEKSKLGRIANSINGDIAIYCPPGFEGAARRIKTQFNENAKLHARWEVFPELNHNEHVGWERTWLKSSVILIRDKREDKRITKRIEYMKKYIGKKAKVFEIHAKGDSKLSRELSVIWQGDMITVLLASKRGVDALPVKSIDALKDFLAKN